jgi:predicted nucleic acid-binding protein
MIVADTNLVSYLLIPGQFTDLVKEVLKRDKVWVAPPLWQHEFLNVVASSVRANHIALADGELILAEAPVYVRSIDHKRSSDVLRLSVETKIATYDCEFVVLARSLSTFLVTKDKALLRAFPDVAVSIEDFASGK